RVVPEPSANVQDAPARPKLEGIDPHAERARLAVEQLTGRIDADHDIVIDTTRIGVGRLPRRPTKVRFASCRPWTRRQEPLARYRRERLDEARRLEPRAGLDLFRKEM